MRSQFNCIRNPAILTTRINFILSNSKADNCRGKCPDARDGCCFACHVQQRPARLNTKYLAASWVYPYTRLLAIITASVQGAIIYKSGLCDRLSKCLPAIWTVALHYKQTNRSIALGNILFSPNASKSLMSKEQHYSVFHFSFLSVAQRNLQVVAATPLQILLGLRIGEKTATLAQNSR